MKRLLITLTLLCGLAAGQTISGGNPSGIAISGNGIAIGPTSSSSLVITTSSVPGASQGIAYTPFTFLATGGTPCGGPAYNWTVSAGALPSGYALSLAGVLTGTTTSSGSFPFTVNAADCGANNTPKNFTLVVTASSSIVISNATPLPAGTQGAPYSQTFTATGGVPCGGPLYTWSQLSGTIPPGITLVSSGTFSGTPSSTGTFSFTVQAADCGGNTTPKAFSVTIDSASAPGAGENAYCTGSTDGTCFTGGQVDSITEAGVTVTAQLPTAGINTDTSNTPAGGSTTAVAVASCAAIQTALNSASCGDHIQIPALNGGGQNTQTCNITLPNHSCDSTHWIWLESNKIADPAFPLEHIRATPCAINVTSLPGYPTYPCGSPSFLMPQIQCASSANQSCITPAPGANFYRLVGLELVQPNTYDNDGNGLVDLTPGADHIVVDRSMLHGPAVVLTKSGKTYTAVSHDLKNGVQLQNSTNIGVINSWIYDIVCPRSTCTDSHAFGGGNGTATSSNYKIYNNLIAAAGENILQGGAGSFSSTITIPTNGEVRENHFVKPVQWFLCTGCNGEHVEPKNFFEIKNGKRWLFEGNVTTNNTMGWQTDQAGYAIGLDPRNQNNTLQTITVTSDGAGHLTATNRTFGTGSASPVSPNCANSGHCQVTVGSTKTTAVSQTDATHITVSPAPAAGSGIQAIQCTAGLNPLAVGTDIVVRFNDLQNSTNGFNVGSVVSDCGDVSPATANIVVHDNLIQGINSDLNNASSGNSLARCFYRLNGSVSTLHDVAFDHNTCLVTRSGNFGYSGLDVTQDIRDTTTNGSSGAYLSNMITANNIGPGGGIFTYSAGLYPGGALAGLKQQSCTPPVTGATCTWAYTHNVLGQGLWFNQINNTPFPATNQTCGGTSCFPSGSAFTSIFNNYHNGYLGNYQLAGGSPFINAGTDGKNLGADIATLNTIKTGVASTINYTPAVITTSTVASGTVGVLYPNTQLLATSASDMQVWRVTSGALPAGMSLSAAGVLQGTPTASGSFAFTAQMMDAAQQFATHSYTLTISSGGGGGGGGGGGTWALVSTPGGAGQIRDFAINPSNNHWMIADRVSGIWLSTNQGTSWTQVNTGISPLAMWSVVYDSAHSQFIAGSFPNTSGPVKFYRTSNEGTSWTPITYATINIVNASTYTGCVVDGSGNLVCGGFFGAAGHCGTFRSTDGGATTAPATCNTPGGSYSHWYNSVTNDLWMGTEQYGAYRSTNGGLNWTEVSPADQVIDPVGGIRDGNAQGMTNDNAGNMYMATQGGVWKSSGSGGSYTWSNVLKNVTASNGRTVGRDASGTLYYGHSKDAGNPTTVFCSSDNGLTWPACSTGIPTLLEAWKFLYNSFDSHLYAVIQDGSTNQGFIYKK